MREQASSLRRTPSNSPPSLEEARECPLWWIQSEDYDGWRDTPIQVFTTVDDKIYVAVDHELTALERWCEFGEDDLWMPCAPPTGAPPTGGPSTGVPETLRTALLVAREQLACLGTETDDVHQAVLAVVDDALREIEPQSPTGSAPRVVEGKPMDQHDLEHLRSEEEYDWGEGEIHLVLPTDSIGLMAEVIGFRREDRAIRFAQRLSHGMNHRVLHVTRQTQVAATGRKKKEKKS
jgi:hypothetical protein